MAVIIQGGTGSGYRVAVTDENRLKVDSILSGTQEVAVSGTFNVTANTGSIAYMFGKSGTDYYPILTTSGSDGGVLRIDGTISATTGSQNWIQNFGDLGSTVVIDSPASIGSFTTQTIDGTVVVTDIASAGSIAIQTINGSVNQGTDPWIILGSVAISSPISVSVGSESWIKGGSLAPFSGTSYVNVTQTTSPWIVLGSVYQTNSPSVTTGSESYIKNVVGVTPSGTFSVDTGGYLGSKVYLGDSPWIISGEVTTNAYLGSNAYIPAGSVIITNSPAVNIGDTGSVRAILDNPESIGSFTTQTIDGTIGISSPETIGSYTTQGVVFSSGTGYINVTQTTSPWVVVGSVNSVIDNYVAVGSYTTQTVDGTVSVTGIETAGSLAIQTVDGTVAVTDIASAGSLAVQTINGSIYSIGSINIVTNPLPISGELSITTGSQVWIQDTTPTDSSKLNEATQLIYSGTVIGSLIKFDGTGSYVRVLTYTDGNLTNVGSWV